MAKANFEWDDGKDAENQAKHGIAFVQAQCAFAGSEARDCRGHGTQLGRTAVFLLRASGRGRTNRSIHVPRRKDSDYRRWLLAQRKDHL